MSESMPLLKRNVNSLKKKEPVRVKTKTNVKLSVEEIKRKAELRKRNIERQKRLIKNIKILNLFSSRLRFQQFNSYSRILAREILITEAFVNRLRKKTNRPIVVIGNGGTGKPYTWSIEKKSGMYIKDINYPSTKSNLNPEIILKLKKIITDTQHKLKKPLFVFVDASRKDRMPAALTGYTHEDYTQPNESISQILPKNKVKIIGYDWSMKDGRNNLPKSPEIDFKKTDYILFNPVGKGKEPDKFSALHDNFKISKNNSFKELTLKRVELLKLQWFGE
jgi:hypothetical protein